jgi:hypothetical protein
MFNQTNKTDLFNETLNNAKHGKVKNIEDSVEFGVFMGSSGKR